MIDLGTFSVSSVPAFDYKTMIREKHLDVFGHVNNAQYMVLFEEARWEMITERGYGLAEVLDKKIGTVVLESTIRYRRELKNRESITIRVELVSVQKKIFKLHQKILKENGEIAADAEFSIGCFDLQARKLIHPPELWLNAILGQK